MSRLSYYVALVLIIFGMLILLSPSISSSFLSSKRHIALTTFISHIERDKKLDPQEYWEFREFYSPGTFTFQKEIHPNLTSTGSLLTSDLSQYAKESPLFPFLLFHSGRIESVDLLVNKKIDLTKYNNVKTKYLIKNPELTVSDEGHYYRLTAIFLTKDMKKANGFYENNASDPFFNKNYYITILTVEKE